MGQAVRSVVRSLIAAAVVTVPTVAATAATPSPGTAQVEAAATSDVARGRVHYIASCARCHGVNGGGGEGPPLARSALPRAPDDDELIRIMSEGIPGSAMSGSWWLSEGELRQVAVYVRALAPAADAGDEVIGDGERGAAIYEREGCGGCHTVGGFGTGRGPDLTSVGLRRGPAHLREALLDPGAALPRGGTAISSDFVDYLMVRVVDAAGNLHRGMRMNEDSYTIQLKDGRGVIRSFYKPDLRELEKEFDRSLMGSYRDRLTDQEVDDLVTYLMSLTRTGGRMVS